MRRRGFGERGLVVPNKRTETRRSAHAGLFRGSSGRRDAAVEPNMLSRKNELLRDQTEGNSE